MLPRVRGVRLTMIFSNRSMMLRRLAGLSSFPPSSTRSNSSCACLSLFAIAARSG